MNYDLMYQFHASETFMGFIKAYDRIDYGYDQDSLSALRENPNATKLGTFVGLEYFGVNLQCRTCQDTKSIGEAVLWSDGWGIAHKPCPTCRG